MEGCMPEETQANQGHGSTDKQVPERDLLAIKASRDSLELKLKEAEARIAELGNSHKTALDSATTKLYATEASIKKLEEQIKESAGSLTELAGVKLKLADFEKQLPALKDRATEYRKKLIVSTFNIPESVIKDKSLEQLDLYEEALKAVSGARGAGNYAAGGGATGGTVAPLHARERIRGGFDTLHPTDKG
jgi:hypothetical protein